MVIGCCARSSDATCRHEDKLVRSKISTIKKEIQKAEAAMHMKRNEVAHRSTEGVACLWTVNQTVTPFTAARI
jgi:hypothetical protein